MSDPTPCDAGAHTVVSASPATPDVMFTVAFAQLSAPLQAQGCTWLRPTIVRPPMVPEGSAELWVEGWNAAPDAAADFDRDALLARGF